MGRRPAGKTPVGPAGRRRFIAPENEARG